MAIPTDIAQLSQTPALNGPDGNVDPPSSIDDGLRFAYSCIAKLRDGVGYTVAIGMPVKTSENSTGGVSIGYRTSLSKFTIADGATVYTKWPIDISGKADTAATADTATNANAFRGISDTDEFVRRGGGTDQLRLRWDGTWLVFGINANEFAGIAPIRIQWTSVQNRPTNLNQFTNGPGYQTAADVDNFAVQRIDSVTQLGNVGSTAMRANITGFGVVAWGVTPSDARLKTDIAPTGEDSLSKIERIDFRQFRFRQDVTPTPIDDGRLHRLGVIAQELELIDPEWVNDAGTWKAPDQQALLYAALQAIKQQQGVIAALQTRIQALEERA